MKTARKVLGDGGVAPVTALDGGSKGLRAATVIGRDEGARQEVAGGWQSSLESWIVRAAGREFTAIADASVDPALLAEAARSGARVLLDMEGEDAAPTATRTTEGGTRGAGRSDGDMALPAGARLRGAPSPLPVIIGVLQTQRALTIDRHGVVDAAVNKLRLTAHAELLLSAPRTFLRMKAGEVEVYGDRVITRAREIAKTLARMISLN